LIFSRPEQIHYSSSLNANFVTRNREKMPYEEVYFQKMEDEKLEKLTSKKQN
jgi:hypothetical protein